MLGCEYVVMRDCRGRGACGRSCCRLGRKPEALVRCRPGGMDDRAGLGWMLDEKRRRVQDERARVVGEENVHVRQRGQSPCDQSRVRGEAQGAGPAACRWFLVEDRLHSAREQGGPGGHLNCGCGAAGARCTCELHQAGGVEIAGVRVLADDIGVAGKFSLDTQLGGGLHGGGVEPEDGTAALGECIPQRVAALDVLQLMPEDRRELIAGVQLAYGRNKDDRMSPADGCR